MSQHHTVGRRIGVSGNTSIRLIIGIVTFCINACPAIAIERADSLAFGNDAGTIIANARHHPTIQTWFLSGQFHHLVLQISAIHGSGPIKVIRTEHISTDSKVNPFIGDLAGINQIGRAAQIVRQTGRKKCISSPFVKVIETQGQTVVP